MITACVKSGQFFSLYELTKKDKVFWKYIALSVVSIKHPLDMHKKADCFIDIGKDFYQDTTIEFKESHITSKLALIDLLAPN